MKHTIKNLLQIDEIPQLENGTLVLAFSGWMDGGDVSTGTVNRLIYHLGAKQVAEIDPEPFYILNFPGSMEIAALFRPMIEVEDGLVTSVTMPHNRFYVHESSNLLLFMGKEPNMYWETFAKCIFHFAQEAGISQILFVGSFGGSVPHTRQPRMFVTCSEPDMLPEMERYAVRGANYEGPGSFTSYLMSEVGLYGMTMASLVAEIPGYLQGTNFMSIEAVTRRLAKILQVSLDLDSLRAASTEWELNVSSEVEEDEELSETVRQLEEEYDEELLKQEE